jgi:hypothetical protein
METDRADIDRAGGQSWDVWLQSWVGDGLNHRFLHNHR